MSQTQIEHIETEWVSPQDGQRLFAREWKPLSEPEWVICLVHGLGEHSGRYHHLGEFFAKRSHAVLSYDVRGHGRTPGSRGVIPSYRALLEDITQLLEEADRRYPGRPKFLYGHSLGGNQVINYLLRYKPKIAGGIVTGPALRTAFDPPLWKVWLAKTLEKAAPALALPNGLRIDALSRDEAVVQAYKTDPFVHDRLSVLLGLETLRKGEWALEHAAKLSLPLLLMFGEADKIISGAACREFAQRAGSCCTLKPWPNLYHEIHNEVEKESVLNFALTWMEQYG